MRSKTNKLSIAMIYLFYFIFVFRMISGITNSNDMFELILFNKEKFNYKLYVYIMNVMPFFIFVGYNYLTYIDNMEKGIISFFKYRADSSIEILWINFKDCLKFIILETLFIILMMYLYSYIFKVPLILNGKTIYLWILILSIVSCQYLFMLITLTCNFMEAIIALLLIVTVLIIVFAFKINIFFILTLEIIVFIFIVIKKRRF